MDTGKVFLAAFGAAVDELGEKYVGFKKLKGQIAAKGKVRDPGAVAAAIGRKKYGKEKFQKAAAQGKKMKGMSPSKKGKKRKLKLKKAA